MVLSMNIEVGHSFAKTCILNKIIIFAQYCREGARRLGYLCAFIAWFYFIHLFHGVVSQNFTNKQNSLN